MLKKLTINNFKSIDLQEFDMKNITILTGLNSTGKSTVIQALLLLSSITFKSRLLDVYIKKFSNFYAVRNKYKNAKSISFNIVEDDIFESSLKISSKNPIYESRRPSTSNLLKFEENLFYISANRIGQEDIAELDENIKFGTDGKYVFGYFEQNKDKKIIDELIRYKEHNTLDAQLSYWLKYILDIDLRIETSKITDLNIKVTFQSDGLTDISPFNLGAGNSYLAKILIMGLSCKKNNILIIENPEIHLHPKAQAKISDFFIMLSNAGIQLIIETHSEHILNKMRYNVYKNNIKSDEIVIYYKKDITTNFDKLLINQSGHFTDDTFKKIDFPSGFFDSTLDELLEIM